MFTLPSRRVEHIADPNTARSARAMPRFDPRRATTFDGDCGPRLASAPSRRYRRASVAGTLDEAGVAAVSADAGMRRTLGPVALGTLGVATIVGSGIFVLVGEAAAQYAGP